MSSEAELTFQRTRLSVYALPQCFVYDGKRFMNLPVEEKGVFHTYAARCVIQVNLLFIP